MQKGVISKRRRADTKSAGNGEERLLRLQIMQNTGVGATVSVDPVYQLIGSFRQQFDAIGRQKNSERREHGAEPTEAVDTEKAEHSGPDGSRERLSAAELRRRHDSPVYSHSARELAEGDFTDRFSSHAFNYGTLAASVAAGRGKEMFTTCCRRAGIYQPYGSQWENRIHSAKSTTESIRNEPASLMFDGEVKAAVGLVVDTTRGASRIFKILEKVVNDDEPHSDNLLKRYGVETMRDMYPFMRLDGDRRLIEGYRAKLKAIEGDSSPEASRERRTLSSALKKAEAVMERKNSEKRRFLTAIARIQSNVKEAEKMFSSDGFAEEVMAELRKEPELPPDDGNNKRRTLEDSILGEVLDAIFGGADDDISSEETNGGRSEAEIRSDTADEGESEQI